MMDILDRAVPINVLPDTQLTVRQWIGCAIGGALFFPVLDGIYCLGVLIGG